MKSREHLPWIDWLRFAAAAMVLFVHARAGLLVAYGDLPASQKGPVVAALYVLTRLGNEAVIVFFVLSGFLVAGKGISRLSRGTFQVGDYAIDRLTRIYVPYLPALALTCVVAGLLLSPVSPRTVASHVVGLQGVKAPPISILWTLAYEIWFYVGLGAVAAFVRYRNGSGFRLTAAVALLFLTGAVFTVLSATYLMCWIAGGVAYFWRPARFRKTALVATGLLCVAAVAGNQIRSGTESASLPAWATWVPPREVCQLLLASAAAGLVSVLATSDPRSGRLRRVERAGTIPAAFSYTLYLTHVPVLTVISRVWPKRQELSAASVGAAVGACCLCLLAAWLMYLPFEKQTPKVRRWLRGLMTRREGLPNAGDVPAVKDAAAAKDGTAVF